MKISASVSYIRISPRKVRLIADVVRGKPVQEAIDVLSFTRKTGAREVRKLLQSAVANGEQRGGLKTEALYVHRIMVGPGPTLKRFRPRSMGRANMIKKRTSHIKVELTDSREV
jgi:large subunit ribosomal protein L22